MRKLLLALVLTVATAGLIGMTPSQAEAAPWNRGYVSSYYYSPGAVYSYGYYNPGYATSSYAMPAYSYPAPAYSYAAPAYSYAAPAYSYAAPAYSYAAPTYSYGTYYAAPSYYWSGSRWRR